MNKREKAKVYLTSFRYRLWFLLRSFVNLFFTVYFLLIWCFALIFVAVVISWICLGVLIRPTFFSPVVLSIVMLPLHAYILYTALQSYRVKLRKIICRVYDLTEKAKGDPDKKNTDIERQIVYLLMNELEDAKQETRDATHNNDDDANTDKTKCDADLTLTEEQLNGVLLQIGWGRAAMFGLILWSLAILSSFYIFLIVGYFVSTGGTKDISALINTVTVVAGTACANQVSIASNIPSTVSKPVLLELVKIFLRSETTYFIDPRGHLTVELNNFTQNQKQKQEATRVRLELVFWKRKIIHDLAKKEFKKECSDHDDCSSKVLPETPDDRKNDLQQNPEEGDHVLLNVPM